MFDSFSRVEDSLFGQMRRLEREFDQLVGGGRWSRGIRSVARGTFPAVNVGSTPDAIDVYLFVPGIDAQSLELSIQRNLLSVSGKRAEPNTGEATYHRRERFAGDFRRVIALPDDADPDRVHASYRDGILHIAVQRREAAKPRQIAVQ